MKNINNARNKGIPDSICFRAMTFSTLSVIDPSQLSHLGVDLLGKGLGAVL